MKNKHLIRKYSYNIDTIRQGQKIAVMCAHKNCKRYIVVRVIYPSTMECYSDRYKTNFDMRNQQWTCKPHSIIHDKKN